MAEDGIGDYGHAKRKAARSLGIGEGEALPSNQEVEAELRAYQSLYQEDELEERLRLLRETALEVMTLMAEFRPYLVGPVLEGTAGRYAEVEIELYADSGKDVEIMLLSHNIQYEISDNHRHGADTPEEQLRLDWDGVPVRLAVHPINAERQQKRDPHRGYVHPRANAKAVSDLLA